MSTTRLAPAIGVVDDAATARAALSPLRRDLLRRLATPGSAASLAAETGLARQKIGYHLRALEEAGLVTLAGERQRRGFTERLLVARRGLVIDPMILANPDPDAVDAQDRHAASHLMRAAAETVREVARMRAAAEAQGSRLLTFTIEAEIGFAAPAEIDRFAERLTGALAALAADFPPGEGRRRYRVTIGGHPAPARTEQPKIN